MYGCRVVLKKVFVESMYQFFVLNKDLANTVFKMRCFISDLQEIEEEILMKRNEFVEEIGEYDDDIGELVINEKEVKIDDLKNAIRRIVLNSKALITFCGSAYKVRIFWEGHKIFKKSPTSDLTD